MDWDNVRVFLAVARSGQFVAAAKRLRLDHATVSRRIAAGDTHLQLVEGTDLLGPSRVDGLVDGTHPNDLGFQWMAEGLTERLRKVLGL